MRHARGSLRLGIALGAALAVCATAFPLTAETISGICPDGSIFVVRDSANIPCSEARHVEPGQMPPIKPQYLPRPYAWELHQARQDPNNPYNLVEPEIGAPPPAPSEPARHPARPTAPAPVERKAAPRAPAIALSDEEIRDLVAIVELSQQRAPATLADGDGEEPALLLRLARSAAFESRLREAFSGAEQPLAGPVLLFTAEAREPVEFYPNLTFAQAHEAFHPDPTDRRQLALLRGRQGTLETGEISLGYVVLPARTDLAEPVDIYWNDRRISAVLAPGS